MVLDSCRVISRIVGTKRYSTDPARATELSRSASRSWELVHLFRTSGGEFFIATLQLTKDRQHPTVDKLEVITQARAVAVYQEHADVGTVLVDFGTAFPDLVIEDV